MSYSTPQPPSALPQLFPPHAGGIIFVSPFSRRLLQNHCGQPFRLDTIGNKSQVCECGKQLCRVWCRTSVPVRNGRGFLALKHFEFTSRQVFQDVLLKTHRSWLWLNLTQTTIRVEHICLCDLLNLLVLKHKSVLVIRYHHFITFGQWTVYKNQKMNNTFFKLQKCKPPVCNDSNQ